MLLWLLTVALAQDPDDGIETAQAVYLGAKVAHTQGGTTVEDVYTWSRRWMEAEQAAGDKTAPERHVVRMKELAERTAEQVAAGMAPRLDLDRTRFFQAEAAALAAAARVPPTATPTPTPLPAPALSEPTDIDACFTACDGARDTCLTDAEHYRLGIGDVADADKSCVDKAEAQCGSGKSAGRVACREDAIRACEGVRRTTLCTQQHTTCNARCR